MVIRSAVGPGTEGLQKTSYDHGPYAGFVQKEKFVPLCSNDGDGGRMSQD